MFYHFLFELYVCCKSLSIEDKSLLLFLIEFPLAQALFEVIYDVS